MLSRVVSTILPVMMERQWPRSHASQTSTHPVQSVRMKPMTILPGLIPLSASRGSKEDSQIQALPWVLERQPLACLVHFELGIVIPPYPPYRKVKPSPHRSLNLLLPPLGHRRQLAIEAGLWRADNPP